jgi:hypothetical protein
MRNSAVSRAFSSVLPSARPEMTRFPAKMEAPLLPTKPLQITSGTTPWRCRQSAA